jgi:exodeoxyribonuclease VII large subunit
VLIFPVPVQGAMAAPEITAAVALAGRRGDCDVLIVARGGGSLEDLWAFNDESLARAIVASPIPVVSGVGHEIDFTIADFAADVRAPTPSAAAEIVVPDAQEWLKTVRSLGARLLQGMRRQLQDHRERLRWLAGRAALVSPTARLAQQMQSVDDLEERLARALANRLMAARTDLIELRSRLWQVSPVSRLHAGAERHRALWARLAAAQRQQLLRARECLAPLVRTLNAVSPLATLDRGYAIVSRADGAILRDAGEAPAGSLIEARLAVGSFRAKVEDPAH